LLIGSKSKLKIDTIETDPSAIKVPRKKAKLSVSSNSSSSQNNLTLNEEIQQVGMV
jgi:hypothetical protein